MMIRDNTQDYEYSFHMLLLFTYLECIYDVFEYVFMRTGTPAPCAVYQTAQLLFSRKRRLSVTITTGETQGMDK